METSLFILFLLGMYERQFVARRPLQAAVFASLAILTRIDALLAVAPVFVYVLWTDWKSGLKAAGLGILLLGTVRELDTTLRPGEARQFTVYKGNRTPNEALAAGIAARDVWVALCRVQEVPPLRWHGAGRPTPPRG